MSTTATIAEQHADEQRADGVVDGGAGELVQPDAEEGEHEPDERRGILGEDGAQGRVRTARDVLGAWRRSVGARRRAPGGRPG